MPARPVIEAVTTVKNDDSRTTRIMILLGPNLSPSQPPGISRME